MSTYCGLHAHNIAHTLIVECTHHHHNTHAQTCTGHATHNPRTAALNPLHTEHNPPHPALRHQATRHSGTHDTAGALTLSYTHCTMWGDESKHTMWRCKTTGNSKHTPGAPAQRHAQEQRTVDVTLHTRRPAMTGASNAMQPA